MIHPDHVVDETGFALLPLIEPVYPLGAGVSAKLLQKAIRAALARMPALPEWTAPAIIRQQDFMPLRQAVEIAHRPENLGDLAPQETARRRLAHDELLAGQLALALLRERMRRTNGKSRVAAGTMAQKVQMAFGRTLTQSQAAVLSEIRNDLARPERMLRLLQGDVGSGKTIVAMLAMADVIEDGGQAALMAPTEVLARQHGAALEPLCAAAGIALCVLTGREKGREREAILEGISSGRTQLVIGTHALFQEKIAFADLALVVIDEQHRFGVHQRLALGDKGGSADVLVMTATPIPRTLVLSHFGDMEVSRLTGKPAGRQPIRTTAMPLSRIDELLAHVAGALSRSEKLYWICPLVEESEEVDATAAEDRHRELAERFGSLVGLVHGRMSGPEKDEAMEAFRTGRTRLLVATTVIEVGVDVPDATIIVIEHAERFGLAQMHQLRGRVGRGDKPSSCILLYKAPLGETAAARLKILRETEDGFRIAEEDLKLRGEGELLGTRQSGAPGFALADLSVHGDLLELARDEARLAVATNPGLEGPHGEALRTLLYLFRQDQAARLIRAG
jgi:ATP-dependent DNA helicase RecG